MILEKISLTNFKNYEKAELEFCPGLNCFTGLNGSGKTNLLDAIHYLSMTKSAFNASDSQNIRHNENFFAIRADLAVKKKNHQIQCSIKQGGKKSFKVDEDPYEKLSEHIGKFPVVLIAPNDDDLIRDSSDTRRKFFDSIISQADKKYLEQLIQYNHFLKQRNSLLKRINESGKRDDILLDKYDEQLIQLSQSIGRYRQEFIEKILPMVVSQYEDIAQNREKVSIEYLTSVLSEGFKNTFKRAIEKDILLQRTTVGVHRDDYSFQIESYPLKKNGSQGQQKSFLIALKVSQFEYLKELKQVTPILLLDDIFDKLDDERIKKLLEMISRNKFRQIFITDARHERTEHILKSLDVDKKIFNIQENCVFCD
ncbi:MAG: DNA replication/repair protein RecF [Cyclobacteriaceae bacterium]